MQLQERYSVVFASFAEKPTLPPGESIKTDESPPVRSSTGTSRARVFRVPITAVMPGRPGLNFLPGATALSDRLRSFVAPQMRDRMVCRRASRDHPEAEIQSKLRRLQVRDR